MKVCTLHYEAKPCRQCEAKALPSIPGSPVSAPAVIVFREGVYEHMQDPWEKPLYISTPQSLRDQCEARGLTSKYLRDGIWRTRSNRWI